MFPLRQELQRVESELQGRQQAANKNGGKHGDLKRQDSFMKWATVFQHSSYVLWNIIWAFYPPFRMPVARLKGDSLLEIEESLWSLLLGGGNTQTIPGFCMQYRYV